MVTLCATKSTFECRDVDALHTMTTVLLGVDYILVVGVYIICW